ncbi:MAG: TIGR03016 family PEP-CTERM system-associated outer membrane protein [Gammaproteobacteria bacterium]
MGITANSRTTSTVADYARSGLWLLASRAAWTLALVAAGSAAQAGDWTITPSVQLSEIYTSNVRLAPSGSAKSDLITEAAPSVKVRGKGSRLKLDAEYRLQGLLYANESSLNHVYQQLSGKASSELVRDYLFMDADANIGQQPLNPATTFEGTSLAGSGTQTNVYTYRLSPYIRHDFGGVVTALGRYTHYVTRYGQSGISNATGNRAELNLASGQRFRRLTWNASYYNDRLARENADNVDNESAAGTVRYGLTNSWGVMARVGYEHHKFTTTNDRGYNNGSYWAGGFSWMPNRHLSIDALYGDRYKSVDAQWAPTSRTALRVNWVKRDVGLNPGRNWNGSFSLKTRHTTWDASYVEDTASYQQLVGLGTFYVDPVTGQVYATPPNNVFTQPIDLFVPTNEVFTRKRGQASVGVHTHRTDAMITAYSERRNYLVSLTSQRVFGLSGTWNWRFATRTTLLLGANARRTRFLDTSQKDDLWYVLTGLRRSISTKADVSLTYRYARLNSSVASNDYRENRVTLTLNKTF